jgi:DNA-binding GntR family transcriptional regulator
VPRNTASAAIESLIQSGAISAKTGRGGFVTLALPNYQRAMMPVVRNWLQKAVAHAAR